MFLRQDCYSSKNSIPAWGDCNFFATPLGIGKVNARMKRRQAGLIFFHFLPISQSLVIIDTTCLLILRESFHHRHAYCSKETSAL